MAAIITAEKDNTPRIFIPNISELEKPLNAPSDEQIEVWHNFCNTNTVYKQKGVDPQSLNGKLVFKPTCVIPKYDGVNVEYRYDVVGLVNVKDEKGDRKPYYIRKTSECPNGIAFLFPVPAKSFLDLFVAYEG